MARVAASGGQARDGDQANRGILTTEGVPETLRYFLCGGELGGLGFQVPAACRQSPAYKDAALAGGLDGSQEIAAGVRLDDITACPDFQGVLGHPQGVVLAHEDNPRFWGNVTDPASSFDAADAGEADIQQNYIGAECARHLDSLFTVRSLGHDFEVGIATNN